MRRLAREFKLHHTTVSKRLAGVTPDGTAAGGFDGYTLQTAVPHLVTARPGDEFNPDNLSPFDRHQYYSSELKRLKLEIEQGIVVDVESLRRELASLFGSIASTLETLPDLLESKGLPRDLIDVVQEAIDSVRGKLYAIVAADEESAA